MKKINIFINFIIILSLMIFVHKFYLKFSNGFRVDKIFDKFTYSKIYKIENDHTFDIDKIFNQKLFLKNKGRHLYVFESEDSKFVVKFVRFHRYEESFYETFLKISLSQKNIFLNEIKKEKKIAFDQTFESYLIANNLLKNETSTIFLSLNNEFDRKIYLYDKFNQKYELNLKNTAFIIQNKISLFSKNLKKVKKDEIAVKNILDAFFDTVNSLYQKKIFNDDRHILKNLGLEGGKVYEIDIGRFKYKEDLLDKKNYENELNYYSEYLKKYLKENIPNAIPYFELKKQQLINNNYDK